MYTVEKPCEMSHAQASEEYWPGASVMPPKSRNCVQDLQDVDAGASLYECRGQSSHAALPLAGLNLPGAQAAHGPPSGPLKPGSQRQSARRPLRGREKESTGQTSHGSVSRASSAAASL
jgi:hypothetical protein